MVKVQLFQICLVVRSHLSSEIYFFRVYPYLVADYLNGALDLANSVHHYFGDSSRLDPAVLLCLFLDYLVSRKTRRWLILLPL